MSRSAAQPKAQRAKAKSPSPNLQPSAPAPWTVFADSRFIDQLEALAQQVQAQRERRPQDWRNSNAAKRLAVLEHLAMEVIPQDPTLPEYRLGLALGPEYTHWFRAKFFQQYRLFFRYHAASRIIVLAWVNDDSTLRAYEKKTDAYAVFKRMLGRGKPPDDWAELLVQAGKEQARFQRIAGVGARKKVVSKPQPRT
jgi:toxin YhaV